jgi:hypothetical protein
VGLVEWERGKPVWKPKRGSGTLAREKADAEREAHEREIAKQVKARDGRCRWPEKHRCRGPLEAAHIEDKKMGGDHGLRTETANEVSVCRWIHRSGPATIHSKDLRVDKETARGADGPLSFWRQTGEYDALGQPVYYCIAREVQRGIVEKD